MAKPIIFLTTTKKKCCTQNVKFNVKGPHYPVMHSWATDNRCHIIAPWRGAHLTYFHRVPPRYFILFSSYYCICIVSSHIHNHIRMLIQIKQLIIFFSYTQIISWRELRWSNLFECNRKKKSEKNNHLHIFVLSKKIWV